MARVGLKPTLGRSFETQVKDLQRRARDAALRPVSEQTLGTTSYSQKADTHNLQPHGNSLARAWKAFTQFDDAFQYGRTSSADLHDIAQAVSEPGMKVTAHDYGSYIRLQGKNGFLDIREVKTATPYISSMDADSAGEVRGGGSQLYQAALDWIHNNGKKVRSDPSGLTWINDTRRTSNLMASALRWGTTQHLSVHPDQGVPWAEGNHEANLTAMAKVEMANAFKAVAQARDWRYDFAHERFIDATGRELTRDDFHRAVVLGDPGTSGIGLSTLQRAVFTASAIEKSERGELEGIVHQAETRGRVGSGLDRITYSLPNLRGGIEQAGAQALSEGVGKNSAQAPLWNGITGYDRRGNPKIVVILSRQDSGAYSIKINGTTHDFSETQTAAITGLTTDQLRALRAGDASAQPVLVAKAAAPAPAKPSPAKPTNEQAQDRSEELTVKKTDADKKHLTGTTEDSINHKLQTYLRNPLHAVGGPKSVWFKGALGFTQSNADDLARQLIFDTRTAYEKEKTKYGQKFDQMTPLQGANGKIISLKVTWIKNPDGVIRLVTITPKNKKHD
ncbi:DUF6883 domain-containing protein, partial [Prosthecobacter dejongeii]|uniref:Uncharacterized protein n=1 Tax=Prosthecobacter dejongeii TaxID=48465 RepID=A0A7W7YJS2_9BACT